MSVSVGVDLTPPQKIVREVVRPFRQLSRRLSPPVALAPASPIAEAEAAPATKPVINGIRDFHPHDCTVEPEGVSLLKHLVRQSQAYPGPIIEIGTLLGVTATHMALAKAPSQRIITVDMFCWNPWGLPGDVQHSLAQQVLYYLIQTGDVELIRSDKNEYFRNYRGPAPSMVFLDAIHDYPETKKDIEWARAAGAKIIAGHDYSEEFPGVMQVVDEFGGPRQLGGTVWVL